MKTVTIDALNLDDQIVLHIPGREVTRGELCDAFDLMLASEY